MRLWLSLCLLCDTTFRSLRPSSKHIAFVHVPTTPPATLDPTINVKIAILLTRLLQSYVICPWGFVIILPIVPQNLPEPPTNIRTDWICPCTDWCKLHVRPRPQQMWCSDATMGGGAAPGLVSGISFIHGRSGTGSADPIVKPDPLWCREPG